MKALSLRQPWAALVLYHGKRLENRRWNTALRGEFLIHAASMMTRLEFDEALAFARTLLGVRCPSERDLRAELAFGGIVGRARLVDVIPPCARPLLRGSCSHPWHMAEQYGFVLEDVRPVPFVALRGWPGFFDVAQGT